MARRVPRCRVGAREYFGAISQRLKHWAGTSGVTRLGGSLRPDAALEAPWMVGWGGVLRPGPRPEDQPIFHDGQMLASLSVPQLAAGVACGTENGGADSITPTLRLGSYSVRR